MAGKVSVECPACTARLNLSEDKVGKKVRCPKCAEVFQAEPQDEDFDDLEDEPKPSSSRKRPAAGGRETAKGSKKGGKIGSATEGGSSLPLIIGGTVAVFALVGAGLMFSGAFSSKPLPEPPSVTMPMAAMPMPPAQAPPAAPVSAPVAPPEMTPAEKILALRWMPTETDVLIHAKVAEIWQAPLLKGPLSNPSVTQGLQEFEKQTGMAITDIESMSVGFVDVIQAVSKTQQNSLFNLSTGMPSPPIPTMPVEDIHYVVVIKSRKPIDLKAISQTAPNASLLEKNGKTYFEVPADLPKHAASGGWSPASDTLILATSKELLATMERGETVIPRKEFKDIDPAPQLVIAGLANAPTNLGTPRPSDSQEVPSPFTAALKANEQYGVSSGRLGLSVKGGFDLQIVAVSELTEGRQKIRTELETLVSQIRPVFEGYKLTAPPLIAELGDLLLSNLKIEEQNSTVKISTSIPDSAQQKLEQLPAVFMMMAMTGGFGGGAGGPGGGPKLGIGLGAFHGNSPLDNMESSEMPGETDAVSATTVEGLPEGLTLTARSAWSKGAAVPSADGKATEVVEILIDVQGEGLEAICAATGATPKTITAEGGGPLKRAKRTPAGGIDAQKTFVPFDVNNSLPAEHPPATLRVRLAVDAPAKMPSKIDVLEGSFKFLTAESVKDVTIENVPTRAKTPLNEPDFKAVGLKMIRSPKDVVPQTIKLQCGKEHFLSRVEGMPGDVVSVTEVERGATIQRLYSNHAENKFPDEFEVVFKIYSNVKEETVTFRFENVPLPIELSRPVVSEPSATLP